MGGVRPVLKISGSPDNVSSPRPPLRFYLQAGLYEGKLGASSAGMGSLINRQLRNVFAGQRLPGRTRRIRQWP